MDSFKTVERRYTALPVTFSEFPNVSGVITLDRGRTVLEAIGDFPIAPESPQGWFDVRVAISSGLELFLHNVIVTNQKFSQHGASHEGRQTSLFPNIIVENSNALTDDNRVRKVQFKLKGWGAFFSYRFSEHLFADHAPPALISMLKDLRSISGNGIFQPDDIYLTHSFPQLIQFTVDDRSYAVWAGRRSRGGVGSSIQVSTEPIGSITFDEPVSLEAAIDACWDWRGYFSQLAMSSLPFTAMSIESVSDDPTARGNIYLPNSERGAKRDHIDRVHPYYMPLNRWEQRTQASSAMQNWLSMQGERRTFRASLNRVLSRFAKRIVLQDVVELCAAIESLGALNMFGEIPRLARDAMAKAAHDAALSHQIELDESRLRGLLGSLQRASLSHRIRTMAEHVDPALAGANLDQLIQQAGAFRQVGAHGISMREETEIRVAPVIEALAALCCRYDLQSAGVPMQTESDARCLPAVKLERAMFELEHLNRSIA